MPDFDCTFVGPSESRVPSLHGLDDAAVTGRLPRERSQVSADSDPRRPSDGSEATLWPHRTADNAGRYLAGPDGARPVSARGAKQDRRGVCRVVRCRAGWWPECEEGERVFSYSNVMQLRVTALLLVALAAAGSADLIEHFESGMGDYWVSWTDDNGGHWVSGVS